MALLKTSLDKTQAITLLRDYYDKFQDLIAANKTFRASDLEDFLAPNFRFSNNGKLITKSLNDYVTRANKFQKRYSGFDISNFLEEPIVEGNRIAVFYKIDLTARNGESKEVFIQAFGTIENNKITNWTQVSHEQGTGDWDR